MELVIENRKHNNLSIFFLKYGRNTCFSKLINNSLIRPISSPNCRKKVNSWVEAQKITTNMWDCGYVDVSINECQAKYPEFSNKGFCFN